MQSIHLKRLLLACVLASVFTALPDMALAGWGRMFCGWAGVFSNSPFLKIFASALMLLFCFKAFTSNVSAGLLFWIGFPIVALVGATAILYGLSGEDCSIPEGTPQGMATPLTQGASQQGSATPLQEQQTQAPDSQLNLPDSAHHGSSIPLPVLQKQIQDDQQDTGDTAPAANGLNVPEAAHHGSSVPLPMLGH